MQQPVVGQPVAGAAVPAINQSQWQDNIVGCFNNVPMCCQSSVCHICTASAIYSREQNNMATGCDCGSCILLWCFSGCCYHTWAPINCGLTCCFVSGMRRTLVQRYGILGESLCASCLMVTCCHLCTMCQIQREMASRGQHCGGICASAPPPAAVPMGQPQMQQIQAAAPLPGAPPVKDDAYVTPGQPVVAAQPVGTTWGSGLFDCAGGPDCAEAFFCPCCVLGHVGSKVNEVRGIPGATSGQLDIPTCVGAAGASYLYHYLVRRELIERYAIVNESPLASFCALALCASCTLAQTRREMGYRGEWPGGLCLKEAPPKAA